jgi:hypothetical protein
MLSNQHAFIGIRRGSVAFAIIVTFALAVIGLLLGVTFGAWIGHSTSVPANIPISTDQQRELSNKIGRTAGRIEHLGSTFIGAIVGGGVGAIAGGIAGAVLVSQRSRGRGMATNQ